MITPPSPDARLTPEQIEERLARQRRELADDVDALAERVAPQARARAAGEELSAKAHETVDSLRAQAESLRERARDRLERAQNGDPESIRVVAAVAGGAVAGAALLGVLIGRSRVRGGARRPGAPGRRGGADPRRAAGGRGKGGRGRNH